MKIPVGAQLCWTCKKACGGCSWSSRFEPVPGWTAVAVAMRYRDGKTRDVDTYSITACPEYEEDARAVAMEPEQKTVVYRDALQCGV